MRHDPYYHFARVDLLLAQLTEKAMTTKQEIMDAVKAEADQVKVRQDELVTKVKALEDQITAGTAVTAADMEEILAGVKGIFTPA